MNVSVRIMNVNEIPLMIDYFLGADKDFLKDIGADKSKLPTRQEWIALLETDFKKPIPEKDFFMLPGCSTGNQLDIQTSTILNIKNKQLCICIYGKQKTESKVWVVLFLNYLFQFILTCLN